LAGLSITKDHAVINATPEGEGGAVRLMLEPASQGAKILVNGESITGPVELHHLTRVIFGTSHVYKV
jgi:hypothetical protein